LYLNLIGLIIVFYLTLCYIINSFWWYNDMFLCCSGAGIGSVFGSLVMGYARHPVLKQQLFSYAILGFALSEAMGLFCLMMAFLILFAF